MNKTLFNLGKTVLKPFPNTRSSLKKSYRSLRTRYLKARYPDGAFLTCNGAAVFCDFSNETYCWYDGDTEYLDYELEVFTSLFRDRPPDVILDVGSHWGFYPAFLRNSEYSTKIRKIIAIEADPSNQKILSKTLAGIDNIPVVQVNAAISGTDADVQLFSGGGTCMQTYSSPNATPAGRMTAISLDSLVDKYLKKGETLTHVKMDIDGFEPAFFAGGSKALKTFRPVIVMEFFAKGLLASGISLEAYWSMLQENYFIKEASYPSRRLIPLEHKDLPYLIAKTLEGITDLVLVPRPVQESAAP